MILAMKKPTLYMLLIIPLLFTGCYDPGNFKNIRVEPITPTYVFPVINSTISFKELVMRSGANTLVGELPGTTMFYMAFRDTTPLFVTSDLFQFSDFQVINGLQVPPSQIPSNFPSGQQIKIDTLFTQIINPVQNAELKGVHLANGQIVVNVVNNFQHQVSGLLRIRSLKNSNNVTEILPLNLNGFGSTASFNRTLSGYTMSLFSEDEDEYNAFEYEAEITITSSGNPSLQGNLDISIGVQQVQTDILIGKFNTLFENDFIKYYISVFNSTILADQYFASPSLNLTIRNSFGVPILLSLPKFEFRNENNGTIIPITNTTQIENGLNIGTPNVIQPITSPDEDLVDNLFILSPQNSNLTDAFGLAPNVLSMATHFTIGDNTNNHDYFIRNNSKVDLLSEIILPIYGRITTHVLSDTLPNFQWPTLFDENSPSQDDLKLELKFRFSNELPFDLAFQAEFLDENGDVVDHFFSDDYNEWFIESAPVNPTTGESAGATPKYSSIVMTKERYLELSQSNTIVFYYKLHTGGSEGTNVKVLSSNTINVQMSIFARINIDLD